MLHHRKISFQTVYKRIQGNINSEHDWQKTLTIVYNLKKVNSHLFLNKRKTT